MERAIRYEYYDVDTTKQYLAELIKRLQEDGTIGERPAASSALCYAARVGSIPMMDTLIQKGVGKTLLQDEQQYLQFTNVICTKKSYLELN